MFEWIAGLPGEVKFVGGYLILLALFIWWMVWMCKNAPEHNEWD